MTARSALVLALLLASCAPPRPAALPVPEAVAPPSPAPVPAAAPAPAPALASPARLPDSVLADSAIEAAHARDSALDAAMLERIAAANPPETGDPAADPDVETAALRGMFDIDVANFVEHGRVKYWIDFFTGPARERMAIWLDRMPHFEPTMRSQLMARGLPGDLAYLPLIESGYSPTAVSRSRAVGMWQFMKGTARLYGLRVDGWVDERRDVPKATAAAVRYLADLTTKFGSPYLAAAAYNGGPGRIQRGLARLEPGDDESAEDSVTVAEPEGAPQAGDAAFFQLADTRYIKKETKDYVPKLIAAAMIAKQPERYGFPKVAAAGAQGPDSLVVPDATGLEVVARLAGLPLPELQELNPSYLRPVTPPGQPSVIRLPAGTGAEVQASFDALSPDDRLPPLGHSAKAGETLTRIAARYGVTVASLRTLNPALKTRQPRRGETVRVPGAARLRSWTAEDRRTVSAASSKRGYHRVGRGETLTSIAARYRVTVSQLRAANELPSGAGLKVGQQLRIPRASAPVAAGQRAATGGSRAASGGRRSAGRADRTHVVRTGETLSSLARRYGVSVQALRTVNGIGSGRPLLAGQRLTIPS